jgi:hypothetical protein
MPIPNAAFEAGDVYIDFPQEELMFRHVRATGQVFQRFVDMTEETETDHTAELFNQAIIFGVPTTAERYFQGMTRDGRDVTGADGGQPPG